MEIIIGIVAAIVALVAGLVIGLRLGQRQEQTRRQDVEERLTDAQVALEAERGRVVELSGANKGLEARLEERERAVQSVQQLNEQMREAFGALSQDALSRNSEEFLRLARQSFETLAKSAEGSLATREEAIKGLVDPLNQMLQRYDLAVQEMERRREGAYSSIDERLRALAEAEGTLQRETSRLVTALRRPEVRGHWGEMTLHNAVEMAGMSQYCDFVEQEQVATEGGAQRPDMIVRLPGGKQLVVDAKVPFGAYLKMVECQDVAEREQCLREHASQCRKHLDGLARKAYWEQFADAPDCVVMFIPMESLFAAALEADAELMTRALQSKVIIATPTTFIAMLYAVNYGWQQQTFAENALQVRELASQLYDRLRVFSGHFQKIGSSLDNSVDAYNKAVGSLERNLLVSARKLKELGTTGKDDVPELKPVEHMARELGAELSAVPDEPPGDDEVVEPEAEAG